MSPSRPFFPLRLLGLAAVLAVAPAAEAQTQARRVFHRADLEVMGIHRLSELVPWMGGWGSTVEGLSWTLGLDGLPLDASGTSIELMIDGQRVDVEAFGGWLPEAAPLAVQQIDSVVVTRAPALVDDLPSPRGAIQIFTRRAPSGVSALGWIRTGSETGDSGPYLFTPRATPNVDRIGADATAVVRYGGRRWEVEAVHRSVEQSVTDVRILERYDTKTQQSYTTAAGPSLRVGVDALGGRHGVTWGRTVHDGFAFLPRLGSMERFRQELDHLGASGTIASAGGTTLAYRASRSGRTLATDPSIADGQLERRFLDAGLGVTRNVGGGAVRLGVGYDERSVRTSGDDDVAARAARAIVHAGGTRRTLATEQRLDVSLSRGEDWTAASAVAAVEWRPDATRGITATVAASGDPPRHPLDDPDAPGPAAGSTRVHGELALRQRVASGVSLEVASGYASVDGGGEPRGTDGATAAPPRGGRFATRTGVLAHRGTVRGTLEYRFQAPVGASAEFERRMEALPTHAVDLFLTYAPVENFGLSLLGALRSGTRAMPLEGLAEVDAALPAIRRVDVAAEKWLWHRRARVQVTLRNAFGATERYHPYGANFDRTFIFGGSLGFPRS